jgi:hypothetical protein
MAAFGEQVSSVIRTSLGYLKTEIEKRRAETGAAKTPTPGGNLWEMPARDSTHHPNPRECRRFSLTRKSDRRERTAYAIDQVAGKELITQAERL